MNTYVGKPDKDALSLLQRSLELMSIVMLILFLGFLVYHQVARTGFFTEKFGAVEMVCLYGPLLFSALAPLIRALTGRRNPARPFEIVTSLFLALGSLWLLIIFPFSFSHLADALPGFLRFVLAWVPDALGQLLLLLQVIISPLTALVTGVKFLSTRRHQPVMAR